MHLADVLKSPFVRELLYGLVVFLLGMLGGAAIMSSNTQKLELENKSLRQTVDSLKSVSTASISPAVYHEHSHVCGFGHAIGGHTNIKTVCDSVK